MRRSISRPPTFWSLLAILLLAGCSAPAAPGGAAPAVGAVPTAPAGAAAVAAPTASASAGGASSAATATPAAALDPPLSPPVAVTVGTLGLASDAAIYIALDKGYFTAQGLDVQDTRFDSGARLIPALAASQIDAGAGSPSAGLFNALSRSIPIEIVGDKGRAGTDSSYMSLLVRKELLDSGAIKDYGDFRGRPIASIANDNSNVIQIDRMMRRVGLTYKDADVVVLPGGDMIAALGNGTIDAAMVAEPIPTRAVAAGVAVRWKGSNEFYPDQQAAILMYSPTFGKDKPDAARRFMVGYVQGLRLYADAFFKNRNRAEVVEILTRYTSLTDPRLFDEMVPFAVDPDGGVNVQGLADDLDWLTREGLVTEKPDLAAHVNLAYVDYAVGKIGRYGR